MKNLALHHDSAATARLRRMLAHRIAVAVWLGYRTTADRYARALALCPSGVWS